jgi:aspartate/methionine/tyrosine aminotransferase
MNAPHSTDNASQGTLPREQILALAPSRIREVANAAMHRDDIIALWFGEPDLPTPQFIVEAAVAAMRAGKTKYSHNLGIAPLRAALADYLNALHRPSSPIDARRIAVTSSGVSALMLAAQNLLAPGEKCVALTPHWPNIGEIPRILSAELITVPLELRDGLWRLDLDRLLDAITPEVKVVWLNSPNNPTGYVMEQRAQRALLERCRALGVWLVSDEVYSRLYFAGAEHSAVGAAAPSLLDIAQPGDRLVVVNSFSKAWAMTGWRLGWLVTPPEWERVLPNVIEYNTSCATEFAQHAAIVALQQGEPFVAQSVARYRAARDLAGEMLARSPRIRAPNPQATFYSFFAIEGERDSLSLAKRLVNDIGVGLAPGIAFGPRGEGHLRLCFAAEQSKLEMALERLVRALAA